MRGVQAAAVAKHTAARPSATCCASIAFAAARTTGYSYAHDASAAAATAERTRVVLERLYERHRLRGVLQLVRQRS